MKSVKRIPQTCWDNLSWWLLLDHQRQRFLIQMNRQLDYIPFQSAAPFLSTNQDSPCDFWPTQKLFDWSRMITWMDVWWILSHILLKWSYFSSESRSSLPLVPPMINALPWQATAPCPYRPVVKFAPLTHWSNFNWMIFFLFSGSLNSRLNWLSAGHDPSPIIPDFMIRWSLANPFILWFHFVWSVKLNKIVEENILLEHSFSRHFF